MVRGPDSPGVFVSDCASVTFLESRGSLWLPPGRKVDTDHDLIPSPRRLIDLLSWKSGQQLESGRHFWPES